MTFDSSLYSLALEKNILGGLINNQEQIIELSHLFSEKEFYERTHSVIFQVLRNCVLSGQKIDKVLLAQKVKDLSISHHGEIDIFTYLDDLSYIKLNKTGIVDTAKELIKLRIRRDLFENAIAVQNYIKNSTNDPIDKIISHVDGLYNKQVSLYHSEDEPIDLYSNIEEFIKEIAKNPQEEAGLKTPYEQWNKLFGGIRLGSAATNIISRAGEGKSTFLWNFGKEIARINDCKTLLIDSEMDAEIQMFRAAAAEAQTNAWYLETGKWAKNDELSDKVLKGFGKINQYKGRLHYISAPNRDIKEIISLIRRWYFKNVGRGNKALIIYDYLKISTDADKGRQEYQQMGDKLSYLNEITHDLKLGLMTAGQQNRGAENQGQRNDDSTTAAVSDRINQYCSFNAVFRKKTMDEISEHGIQHGSHLLKPFKTSRVQGKDNYNVNSTVRTVDPQTGRTKYKQNFINYEIREYGLFEMGTYADVVRSQNLQANLQGNTSNSSNNI